MAETSDTRGETAAREIVITRDLQAPRDAVYRAWTEADRVTQWFGPEGFTTTVTELDLRPGGSWRYVMRGPDGTEYPSKGVFREVVPPERIVTSDEFDEGFEDVVGGDLPQGIVVTTLFDDRGETTGLTLRIAHLTPEDRRRHEEMGVVAGWNSSLDCLEQYVAGA